MQWRGQQGAAWGQWRAPVSDVLTWGFGAWGQKGQVGLTQGCGDVVRSSPGLPLVPPVAVPHGVHHRDLWIRARVPGAAVGAVPSCATGAGLPSLIPLKPRVPWRLAATIPLTCSSRL